MKDYEVIYINGKKWIYLLGTLTSETEVETVVEKKVTITGKIDEKTNIPSVVETYNCYDIKRFHLEYENENEKYAYETFGYNVLIIGTLEESILEDENNSDGKNENLEKKAEFEQKVEVETKVEDPTKEDPVKNSSEKTSKQKSEAEEDSKLKNLENKEVKLENQNGNNIDNEKNNIDKEKIAEEDKKIEENKNEKSSNEEQTKCVKEDTIIVHYMIDSPDISGKGIVCLNGKLQVARRIVSVPIPFIFLPRNKVKFPTNVSSMLSPCFEIENDPSFVYCISENMNNQSQEREVDPDEDEQIIPSIEVFLPNAGGYDEDVPAFYVGTDPDCIKSRENNKKFTFKGRQVCRRVYIEDSSV